MADYSSLIASIEAVIKQNGNNEITGPILQTVLKSMLSAINSTKADTVDIPTALSQLSQSVNYRTVSDAEKVTWNAKANAQFLNPVTGTGTLVNYRVTLQVKNGENASAVSYTLALANHTHNYADIEGLTEYLAQYVETDDLSFVAGQIGAGTVNVDSFMGIQIYDETRYFALRNHRHSYNDLLDKPTGGNFVTLDTAQTITGQKTFGADVLPSSINQFLGDASHYWGGIHFKANGSINVGTTEVARLQAALLLMRSLVPYTAAQDYLGTTDRPWLSLSLFRYIYLVRDNDGTYESAPLFGRDASQIYIGSVALTAWGLPMGVYAATALNFYIRAAGATAVTHVMQMAADKITSRVNFVPSFRNTYDLGESTAIWRNLYAGKWYPVTGDTEHYVEYTGGRFLFHGSIAATGYLASGELAAEQTDQVLRYNIRPGTDATYSFGTASLRWAAGYFVNLFTRNLGSATNKVQQAYINTATIDRAEIASETAVWNDFSEYVNDAPFTLAEIGATAQNITDIIAGIVKRIRVNAWNNDTLRIFTIVEIEQSDGGYPTIYIGRTMRLTQVSATQWRAYDGA